MSNTIYETINKIYDKVGFLEKYGGSLWLTIILILVFSIAISYFYIMNNLEPIKADWVNQRCNPSVIPFAGIINPPDNESAFTYTADNFTNCMNTILQDIAAIALAPIYYLIDVFTELINVIKESVQAIREMVDSIRDSIADIATDVMGRALNFLIPLQQILIKMNNLFSQTQGIMTSGMYTLIGTYETIISAVTSIVQIITTILLGLASMIMVFFAIPFGLGVPFAIPLLIIFILILIPGILVWIVDMMILKKFVNPLPGIPTCFVGDTKIKLNNGMSIPMKDIEVGMILEDNSYVTSILEFACLDKIYSLNGVKCTENHNVKYNDNWIKVKNHPHSVLLDENYDLVYCINTSSKILKINDIIFGDYDELDNNEISEITSKCSKYLPTNFELKDIHKYLDGGFEKNTKIELFDGHSINISDINVNDVLKFGERVIGIVKIKADDLDIKEYTLENNNTIKCGPNIHICDTDLGMVSTLDLYGNSINETFVYHLITDKKTFFIDGVKYYDYNSCIDKFLDLESFSLIKALI